MKITVLGGMAAGSMLGALTMSSIASADGLPITPGLWEVKTQNSTLGTEEVEQACMTESVFDPVSMLGQEEGCEIRNETIAGNSAEYDLSCVDDQAAGKAEGHFIFTIDGDQGNGKVDMTLSISGQSMTVQYNMDAKRLGDC